MHITCVDQYPNPRQREHKMHLNMCWPNPFMPARTLDPSLHVCQRDHKMFLNLCWLKPFYGMEYIKCISTCEDETHPMPARTQKLSHVLTKPIWCQRVHKMHFKKCCQELIRWKRGLENVYLNVFSKLMLYLRIHKIHLNTWWSYSSLANEDTKCISTCVDQTPPMRARTKNASQHV